MRYRSFGNTGLQVSEIGFGCSRIGGVFAQGGGKVEVISVLQKAFESGITFYDTADMYSQGESETLLGQAFQKQRDRVIIASKGGYCLPTQRKLIARVKPLVRPVLRALKLKRQSLPGGLAGSLSQDFTPNYLVGALEASLRRLKTDYIDIYQLHSPPAEIIARGEFIATLENLKKQGKIRYYGVAADTVADAHACLKYSEISSVQMPFGLLDLEALDGVLEQVGARGVGVIARGCYGGGLLKESLTQAQVEEMTPKWDQVLACRELARAQNRPVLEMALQFALRVAPIAVTLLGMRTYAHLADNLRSYDTRPLTDAEYAAITERLSALTAQPAIPQEVR